MFGFAPGEQLLTELRYIATGRQKCAIDSEYDSANIPRNPAKRGENAAIQRGGVVEYRADLSIPQREIIVAKPELFHWYVLIMMARPGSLPAETSHTSINAAAPELAPGALFDLGGQKRHNFTCIAHNAIAGDAEDWRFGIFVDRHNRA